MSVESWIDVDGNRVVSALDYEELLAKYNFMVDSAQQNAKERDAWHEAHQRKQHLISVMHSELLKMGVNFDFHKALEEK